MRNLYHDFGAKSIGVSREVYQGEIEKIAGVSLQWFFEDYVYGTKTYTTLLDECFEYLGVDIHSEPVSSFIAADRKSTRLNSSHVRTSYAVFCSKKKTRPPARR